MSTRAQTTRQNDSTIPLRLALTLPFVLLILVCSGLIGWFSLDNGRRAVLDVAGQLREEVLKRVEEHLTNYLAVPQQINQANALALASGILNINDPVSRQRYFYGVVTTHPLIAYSFFGAPDGEFYGARRGPNGDVETIHAGRTTGGASVYHGSSPVGDPLEERAVFPNFDPRTRPWYKAGAQASGPVWSGVYRHFVLKDLTVTASLPVFSAGGELLGVFGVDYSLKNMHAFLQTIKVGRSGEVFMVERSGELLAATSTPPGGFFSETAATVSRLMATDSGLPRVAAATKRLEAQPGGLASVAGAVDLEFEMDGQRQFLLATPFSDGMGIDWLVVAVVAESDFMDRIDTNTRQTTAMIAVAVLLAIAAGVAMAANLTRPVERLAQAADGLSLGQWDIELPVPNSRELKHLAQAFQSMAGQLQASFKQLQAQNEIIAEHNRTLELRVASRTAELNHLHDRLRAMFEAIPGYIHVIDKDFVVMDICDKMLAAIGLPREQVVGRRCHQVFHGLEGVCGYCPLVLDDFKNAISSRPSQPCEEQLLGHAFMAYSSPIRDAAGDVWGYIECLMDVSALRAAEAELRAAKEQADAANRAKSEFLANMSHELRTPMNGILGVLQLLKATRLDEEQQEYVVTGLTALRNLLNLINDILDLSKVEAGKLDILESAFPIKDMFSSMSSIFKDQIDEKGIALAFEIAPGVPEVVVSDATRIRQVLFNLVGNAIKFTEKGRVDVMVRADGPTSQGKVRLDFTVADTGIGIPADRIGDLFKPFTQIDGSLARRYHGTGLGLSIVKRLVELMGGEVRLESQEGVGTTMRFDILVGVGAAVGQPSVYSAEAAQDASAGARPSSSPAGKATPLKILLVEDEAINQKMMDWMLRKKGHSVVVAGSGEEAIKLLAYDRFDCILMDVQMPGMDGIAATRLIRSADGSSFDTRIPIIALTANAMSGDREKFLQAGMDDYLSKPVDMDTLFKVLGRVAAFRTS